jgi:D-alanine-D-alanine ligase
LESAGYPVVCLGISPTGRWIDHDRSAKALSEGEEALPEVEGRVMSSLDPLIGSGIEVAFPLVHGTWGEDGTLQGLCEILDIPYVGADVTTSAVAMDKALCKRVLRAAGLPVVDDVVLRPEQFQESANQVEETCRALGLPLFVKPSVGGSSVGVSKVSAWAELKPAVEDAFRFDDEVLIEVGVRGAREIECAVLGGREVEAAMVLGEIVPGRDFYDYEDKYLGDSARLLAPAPVEEGLATTIRSLAVEAFRVIGGTGMARVDFLLSEEGEVTLNELNTVPGFTSISMFPRLWDLSGLPLPQLVERLVEEGVDRHRRRHELDRGIKEWIAGLEARS